MLTTVGTLQCSQCGTAVPDHARHCPGCQFDAGFPNVRAASREDERGALNARYENALTSAKHRSTLTVLQDFETAVSESSCVLCTSTRQLLDLLSNENSLRISFHKLVDAGARIPENNKFDRARPAIDGTLFPHYHKEINFGALTLDGKGVAYYGPHSVVLKNSMIKTRTTIFEENSYFFCQEKFGITLGSEIPLGFRALWEKRQVLAVAKLHNEIESTTTSNHFCEILLARPDEEGAEFIELHIYGQIQRTAIDRVISKEPKLRTDRLLWEAAQELANELNIPFEVEK